MQSDTCSYMHPSITYELPPTKTAKTEAFHCVSFCIVNLTCTGMKRFIDDENPLRMH